MPVDSEDRGPHEWKVYLAYVLLFLVLAFVMWRAYTQIFGGSDVSLPLESTTTTAASVAVVPEADSTTTSVARIPTSVPETTTTSLISSPPSSVGGSESRPFGPLQVQGNQIVDAEGQAVRLNGVNRMSGEYWCVDGHGFFDGDVSDTFITGLDSWSGINVVRLPLNEQCWLAPQKFEFSEQYTGDPYQRAVVDLVDRLTTGGRYVILDLHWSAATTKTLDQDSMANSTYSIDFWSSVARTFAGNPLVIFDAFNEPHKVSWECWRDGGCPLKKGGTAAGMQQIVDAIRNSGAHQPIILTMNGWGNNLGNAQSNWKTYAPRDSLNNLIAGVHLYNSTGCNTDTCWRGSLTELAEVVPVVLTEFGQYDCGRDFVDRLLAWVETSDLDGAVAWTWFKQQDCGAPSLTSDVGGKPTVMGKAVREFLARQ